MKLNWINSNVAAKSVFATSRSSHRETSTGIQEVLRGEQQRPNGRSDSPAISTLFGLCGGADQLPLALARNDFSAAGWPAPRRASHR
jgi:hypothetical protein